MRRVHCKVIAILICLVWVGSPLSANGQSAQLDTTHVADPELSVALETAQASNALVALVRSSAVEDSGEVLMDSGERLAAIARAFGYLDVRVDVIEHAPTTLKPRPGPRYRIGAIDVQLMTEASDRALLERLKEVVGMSVGRTANGDSLEELEAYALHILRQEGFAHATVRSRSLIPDTALPLATVRLEIEPGAKVRLGAVSITNEHLLRDSGWEEALPFVMGDFYDPQLIVSFNEKLAELPGIRSARIFVQPPTTPGSLSPVTLALRGAIADREAGSTAPRTLMLVALGMLMVRQLSLAAVPGGSWAWAAAGNFAILVSVSIAVWAAAGRALSFL